jgi:hypothetical protein
MDPRDADTRADQSAIDIGRCRFHVADDLMTGNPWQGGRGQSSFDFVQLGVADAASGHADQDVPGGRIGTRDIAGDQRPGVRANVAELLEKHRAHASARSRS